MGAGGHGRAVGLIGTACPVARLKTRGCHHCQPSPRLPTSAFSRCRQVPRWPSALRPPQPVLRPASSLAHEQLPTHGSRLEPHHRPAKVRRRLPPSCASSSSSLSSSRHISKNTKQHRRANSVLFPACLCLSWLLDIPWASPTLLSFSSLFSSAVSASQLCPCMYHRPRAVGSRIHTSCSLRSLRCRASLRTYSHPWLQSSLSCPTSTTSRTSRVCLRRLRRVAFRARLVSAAVPQK
ncbi:hypothetical protein F4780DRAFT_751341 [Xylariomycetidae sp. FL0641]|nr:hypothetical protein F4780DRAFT_751341 [Xylariomycetidae sp. FL0641]